MESELMKLWGAPRTSWLVSGQDEPARAALLKAELSHSRVLRVIIAAEDAVPDVLAATRRAGFERLRTLPAAGERYFPAFTPGRAAERESRLLELLRVQGWEETEVGKANAYLDFILGLDETVHRAPPRLDMKLLQEYRGVFGVERALWELGLRPTPSAPRQARESKTSCGGWKPPSIWTRRARPASPASAPAKRPSSRYPTP